MDVKDHPLRYEIANEMHARPFPQLSAPSTAVFLAIKQPEGAAGRDREADRAHLCALLDRHGAEHPAPGATHYFGRIGRHRLKWESHTEMVTYTAFADGLSARPFDPADFEVFPADWLADAPGARLTSAIFRIEPMTGEDEIAARFEDWFVEESLSASRVLGGASVIGGDFRIDPAGHLRFAIFLGEGVGARRAGRLVQRLCEVEAYKSLALLGLARARALSPDLARIGARLSDLVGEMGSQRQADETLDGLLEVSADLEKLAAQSSFRFSATAAYGEIVGERVMALREERFGERPTLREMMTRRFDPAMRTVAATERRLSALAGRAMRAAELLRTRVDVERSAQNQALLASMDRRADLQLRLQRTVEGLSVVAISYYAVNLVAYALYPLAKAQHVDKTMLTAGATPIVVLVVWMVVRRIRKQH